MTTAGQTLCPSCGGWYTMVDGKPCGACTGRVSCEVNAYPMPLSLDFIRDLVKGDRQEPWSEVRWL